MNRRPTHRRRVKCGHLRRQSIMVAPGDAMESRTDPCPYCSLIGELEAQVATLTTERDVAYASRAHWCLEAGRAMQERDTALAQVARLTTIAQEVWDAAQETDIANTHPALAEPIYELGHRLHEWHARATLAEADHD